MIGRRGCLALAGGAALGLAAPPARAQRRDGPPGVAVEVWRDPSCGCCSGWVQHLRAEGFAVTDAVVPSVAPVRRMLGTPPDLLSCHAARVAGSLAIEGHVPAYAIRRLLAEPPAGVVGLAVPAMPVGTPGMEVPGQAPELYEVVAWRADGSHRPWLRMRGAAPV
jgi:hypothetical protein